MSERGGLSLIVFSGDYDRVHYAFVIASSAAATGRRVTMFFTMTGIKDRKSTRLNSSHW